MRGEKELTTKLIHGVARNLDIFESQFGQAGPMSCETDDQVTRHQWVEAQIESNNAATGQKGVLYNVQGRS